MRAILTILLLASIAIAQQSPSQPAASSATATTSAESKNEVVIPAGTKIPVALKHAVSTKGAREGDSVYAETTFPVVQNDRVLIPAGTYVQGRISNVKRAGRIKGRAEVLIHFTTLIYPSGYTVILPGSIENVPGADKTSMKGQEGTIRQDSQTGEKIGTAAGTAATGTLVGAVAGGGKGALIGTRVVGAVGTAIAMLTRGNDVKLDAGTTLEMIIQRPVPLDPNRVPSTAGRAADVTPK